MLQNQIISWARNTVMLGVGYLLTWLAAKNHFIISEHTRETVTTLVGFGIALAYYIIVRLLEAKWPKLGVLLGIPAKPHYPEIATPGKKPAEGGYTLPELMFAMVALVVFAIFCS